MCHELVLGVSFRDLDAFSHVNNSVYITWFETVRVDYLMRLCEESAPQFLPVTMARLECAYLRQVSYGDKVIARAKVTCFGRKSYDMSYQILTSNRLVAQGSSVLVFFDRAAQRSVEVPEWFKARVMKYQENLDAM